MKAGIVMAGWIVGYGALNDTGASLRDRVHNVAIWGALDEIAVP